MVILWILSCATESMGVGFLLWRICHSRAFNMHQVSACIICDGHVNGMGNLEVVNQAPLSNCPYKIEVVSSPRGICDRSLRP